MYFLRTPRKKRFIKSESEMSDDDAVVALVVARKQKQSHTQDLTIPLTICIPISGSHLYCNKYYVWDT
jgi:hypothetical protein